MRKPKEINKFAIVQALNSTKYYSAGDVGIVLDTTGSLLRVYWCCQRGRPVFDGIWYVSKWRVKVQDNNDHRKSRKTQLASAEQFFNLGIRDKI